ncbi:MAG: MFS transporter [Syntrophales bacterium]|nr:MFS transporter [Syntrophales bacterium]
MDDQNRRLTFGVLLAVVFLDMLGLGFIIPLLPVYATDFGATGLWVGIIFAGHSFTRLIVLPVIGKSSDKYGRKKPFITVGISLYVLLALSYVWASCVYELVLIRLLQGIASAMIFPIAMAYVGEMSPRGREGSYMGEFNFSAFVGLGCGPFLGGMLKDALGIVYVFYTMTALSAISLILVIFFLPEQKKVVSYDGTNKVISYRRLLSYKPVQGIMIYRTVNALIGGSTLSFLPLLAAKMGTSAFHTGILLSTNTILAGILQRPFGRIADRRSKLFLIVMGSLIGSFSLFSMPLSPNYFALLSLGITMGIGSAMSMPAASAIATRIGKKEGIGSMMGLFTMAMSVGLIVSPMISGTVMDFLDINAVFYIMGTLSVLCTVISYLPLKAYKG